MLTVGDCLPSFRLKATVSNDIQDAFVELADSSYPGQWLVLFFYPKDFTFVCPTEIKAFADLHEEFHRLNAQVLGASIDTEFAHLAWRRSHDDLRELPFPLLADVKRELSSALGILDRDEGVAQRATFIVDPEGVIRFASVTDLGVGRSVVEVLRVLAALQTDSLCPCQWEPGDETLKVA